MSLDSESDNSLVLSVESDLPEKLQNPEAIAESSLESKSAHSSSDTEEPPSSSSQVQSSIPLNSLEDMHTLW